MNNLTSKQRKLMYLVGIVILLIPIIGLGMPAASEVGSGGKLAQLRQEHELGESTLGRIDPTSASMNLVLLGLRGVASTKLWLDAQEQQEHKDWGQLRSTTDSVIMLQPHFLKVWDFQGWNLAYNVSAEWDSVPDRFYWVKEGTKFLIKGTAQNQQFPDLYWYIGRCTGHKIAPSDEWEYFRKYFMVDPDIDTFEGLPDPQINPGPLSPGAAAKDNHLVARDWYMEANKWEGNPHQQHIMMAMLFRHYPALSLIEYAKTRQREGNFGEKTRLAWERAHQVWINDFGREEFFSPGGVIVLEADEATIQSLAKADDVDPAVKRRWIKSYGETCNYLYWRTLTRAESEKATSDAHQLIFRGQQAFKEGRTNRRGEKGELPSESQELLEQGLVKLAPVMARYPSLLGEDDTIEMIMLAIRYWFEIHHLNNQTPPDNFPFKELWTLHENRIPNLDLLFMRENRANQ
ncbi:MAG: hypothetical protein ABGZ17_27105 [Planctomycetaceae bacterium]